MALGVHTCDVCRCVVVLSRVGLFQRQPMQLPSMCVLLLLQLMPESLFLTINLIDRYLDVRQVARKNLQLVSAASCTSA